MAYAVAVPVPQEKLDEFLHRFGETVETRQAEFDDWQRRHGVTAETFYLQSSPQGHLFIVVGEGQLKPTAEVYDESNPFDRWLRGHLLALTGFDLLWLDSEPSTLLGEWRAS